MDTRGYLIRSTEFCVHRRQHLWRPSDRPVEKYISNFIETALVEDYARLGRHWQSHCTIINAHCCKMSSAVTINLARASHFSVLLQAEARTKAVMIESMLVNVQMSGGGYSSLTLPKVRAWRSIWSGLHSGHWSVIMMVTELVAQSGLHLPW